MGIISVLNVAGMCWNAVAGRQWRTNHEQRTMETSIVYILNDYILRLDLSKYLLLTTLIEISLIGLMRPQILCSNFRSNYYF